MSSLETKYNNLHTSQCNIYGSQIFCINAGFKILTNTSSQFQNLGQRYLHSIQIHTHQSIKCLFKLIWRFLTLRMAPAERYITNNSLHLYISTPKHRHEVIFWRHPNIKPRDAYSTDKNNKKRKTHWTAYLNYLHVFMLEAYIKDGLKHLGTSCIKFKYCETCI